MRVYQFCHFDCLNDQREVPRPILMKKVNGTSNSFDRLMRLGTPLLIHFGVSTSNRKQKYFIVLDYFKIESFWRFSESTFRIKFVFFDSELYVFKKLTVYGNELSGNSHHNHLKPDSEHNSGQNQ